MLASHEHRFEQRFYILKAATKWQDLHVLDVSICRSMDDNLKDTHHQREIKMLLLLCLEGAYSCTYQATFNGLRISSSCMVTSGRPRGLIACRI